MWGLLRLAPLPKVAVCTAKIWNFMPRWCCLHRRPFWVVVGATKSRNDVCPYGQVMSATPCDVACGNDVTPDGVMGKHHIIATKGRNIIMRSITSFSRQRKHHFNSVPTKTPHLKLTFVTILGGGTKMVAGVPEEQRTFVPIPPGERRIGNTNTPQCQ